ncbi:MAG: ATP-binding protein [Thalassospira sp.]|uniref:ATP-binding protein n=1 Tax=Thalassospira sp. TaxID=1912094 RepID=UPI003A859B11
MLRLLAYAGFTLTAFLFITPLFLYYASLPDEAVRDVAFPVVVMVEVVALLTIAIGWMVYELTRKAQYVCLIIMMGLLLLGDLFGMPRLLGAEALLGSEQALGTFTGILVLVTRLIAALMFVLSWHYANKEDQIFVQEQVILATTVVFVIGSISMFVPTYFLPDIEFGFGYAFQDISTLILMPTLVMALMGAGGYLVRCFVRRSWLEGMLCVPMMIGVFNHFALFYLAPDGSELAASFILPSRVLSYTMVLGYMLFSMRHHFRHSYQASSAKSEFLATMSHEIRTPLNGVLGLAQLLRESGLNKTQMERVNGILSSGRALMELLNDILDMSKIEAGRVELENRQFYPSDITYDLQRIVGSVAREKNISVVCDDISLNNLMFTGDEVRLRQILWNLMSNAVKFTNKGSVRLEVRKVEDRPANLEDVRALRDGEVLFHFAVIDTGIGISEDRLKMIFAPFTQADNSTMRQYGGTGLGLSIAYSLTELMGGKMTVSSVERRGTRFDVWIPFKADLTEGHVVGHADDISDATDTVLSGARVLVVEDNEINANVVGGMLKRHGVEIYIVPNGRDAVHAFRDGEFDLILMDAHMPILDGEGATRHIRELERFNGGVRIPIICLTADAFIDRHRDFLAAGMDEVLTKPVEERKLYGTLRRFLRKKERNQIEAKTAKHATEIELPSNDDSAQTGVGEPQKTAHATEATFDVENDDADGELLAKTVLVEEVDEKSDTVEASQEEETRMELIDRSRFDEVCAALGKEQLLMLVGLLPASYQEERGRLVEAANNKDPEALRRAAHTIKGMAANMAGQKLADAARALETFDGDMGDELASRIEELDKLAKDTIAEMQEALA